ncbi:MAG: response regulator [Thermodesulfobacteriota bacterium]
MKDSVLVVEGNEEQCQALCNLIRQKGYTVHGICSPDLAASEAASGGYQVVIVDLDLVPLSNQELRELKRAHPGASLLVTSSRAFHPELREAMREHIDVCLSKPVDPDELAYWLRSFHRNRQHV